MPPPTARASSSGSVTSRTGVASANLRGIVSGLGGATHIVMALDVTEQYSASGIRSNIGANPLSRIDPEKVDLDKLAHALAGIQYVAPSARRSPTRSRSTTIVQVAGEGEWLGKIAKSVIPEILDRGGISVPELDNWTVKAEPKRHHADRGDGRRHHARACWASWAC